MAKRFMNLDPEQEEITTDLERLKQRVTRGLQRPLLSLPYFPERGTRNFEMVDKQVNVAIPKILLYSRRYLKNYFSEVRQDVMKVISLQPLVLQFEIDILEDKTND